MAEIRRTAAEVLKSDLEFIQSGKPPFAEHQNGGRFGRDYGFSGDSTGFGLPREAVVLYNSCRAHHFIVVEQVLQKTNLAILRQYEQHKHASRFNIDKGSYENTDR